VRLTNPAPLDYKTPPWPSLYWPLDERTGAAKYLYFTHDIWLYTLLWTLVMFAGTHGIVAIISVVMHIGKGHRSWQYSWAILFALITIAGVEAIMAGSVVGLMSVNSSFNLTIAKPWSRVRIRLFQNVNMDSIFMGDYQCAILDSILIFIW
ncbi:hypothetical protein Golomagni_02737, partial [Golovinomyces magnicellulatus]